MRGVRTRIAEMSELCKNVYNTVFFTHCVAVNLSVLVMTHQPPVYIVQMLPTSSLPNQTTICNYSASTIVRHIESKLW